MPSGCYVRTKKRGGWKLSKETKEKIRIARTGYKYSEETKRRISNVVKGRKVSKETKRKMSIAKWKGGLTPQQRLEIRAGRKRPEICELCGRKGKICFDHCHRTGKFRGWLCYRCNLALGMVGDDPELLGKLVEYLVKNN